METILKKSRPAFFQKAISLGFNVTEYRDGQKFINRSKLFQITVAVVFALSTLINYVGHLNYSLVITLTGTLGAIGVGQLFKRHRAHPVSVSFFTFLNILVFLLVYCEGTSSGSYFFFFIIIIMANFLGGKEKANDLLVVYGLTFLGLVLTFMFCPKDSFLQNIPPETKDMNLKANGSIAFLVGAYFSYFMMRDNMMKEKVLINKQGFLDSVYNSSLDAIFIVDVSTGIITDCNEQSMALFEVKSRGEIIGQPVLRYFAKEDHTKCDVVKRLLTDNSVSDKAELTCVSSRGKLFTGYISVVPLEQERHELKKINILDISDIKEARAALLTAKEKAEHAVLTKTKFLSNMSHELRTPLNGIIGTTNLILQSDYMPGQKQYLNVLKYSSEHMLNVVNDILDFSKIEVGKMELEKTTFNLKDLVNNISNLFRNQFAEKKVGLEIVFDGKLDNSYSGDQTRLGQVLSNLVSNALKFTEKGKVVIKVSFVAQNSNACTIKFSVKDSGIGIPDEKQLFIFDSFTQVDTATTRKFGGTGLGLAISSKIVELFGGKLRVNSKQGEGSEFYFSIQLGVINQQSSYVNETAVQQLQSLKGLKVLLAEDNPINMLIAKTILEKWEIDISEAGNGKEALDLFNANSFDVLLVDLEMPEMDGFELLENVRMTNKNIPVIAFTAAVYENMQAYLINKGFTDYIQKPFRPEEVHGKLERYGKR